MKSRSEQTENNIQYYQQIWFISALIQYLSFHSSLECLLQELSIWMILSEKRHTLEVKDKGKILLTYCAANYKNDI